MWTAKIKSKKQKRREAIYTLLLSILIFLALSIMIKASIFFIMTAICTFMLLLIVCPSKIYMKLNPISLIFIYTERITNWIKDKTNKHDATIRKALRIVDSLPARIQDEKEANRQLYCTLRALNPKGTLQYEPKYKGKNVGDIRIGNTIIEGKLELCHKSEIDRLMGQIDFCYKQTPFKIRVVIYGSTSKEAISRIKKLHQYSHRTRIIHSMKPKRHKFYYERR